MEQNGSSMLRRVPPRLAADEQGAGGLAVVALTLDNIEEALGLPEGVRLMGVRVNLNWGVVEFRFEGRGLPPCAEGAALMRFLSLREAWEYQEPD